MKDVIKKISYCILILFFIGIILFIYSQFDYYIFNTLETTLEFNYTISKNIVRYFVLIIPLIIILVSIYLKKIKKTKLSIVLCIFAVIIETIVSILVCSVLNLYVTEANDYNSNLTRKLKVLYQADSLRANNAGELNTYYTSDIVDFLEDVIVANQENENQVTIVIQDDSTYLSKIISTEYTNVDELNELINELEEKENTYYKVEQEFKNQYISSFTVSLLSEE